jgi:hypothetical protein
VQVRAAEEEKEATNKRAEPPILLQFHSRSPSSVSGRINLPVALTVVKIGRDGKSAVEYSNDRSWLILRAFCDYKKS